MRKFTILTAFLCSGFMAFSQNAEDEAIKKVIRAETEAYFKRDLEAWKATWLHDPKINRTFIYSNSYTSSAGWDSAQAELERNFRQYPDPVPLQISNENYNILTKGDMAWVDYDQALTMSGMDTANGNGRSHEYRVLVKEGGQWKIVTQITTDAPQNFNAVNPLATENNLNATGYGLLRANKLNDAIDVFKLNVKFFPNSHNTYDSLGEAYALAGNKKLAIENYEKALKLNPKSNTIPPILATLKGK
jgi:tetratricopeptide (TPR) repeat protein